MWYMVAFAPSSSHSSRLAWVGFTGGAGSPAFAGAWPGRCLMLHLVSISIGEVDDWVVHTGTPGQNGPAGGSSRKECGSSLVFLAVRARGARPGVGRAIVAAVRLVVSRDVEGADLCMEGQCNPPVAEENQSSPYIYSSTLRSKRRPKGVGFGDKFKCVATL